MVQGTDVDAALKTAIKKDKGLTRTLEVDLSRKRQRFSFQDFSNSSSESCSIIRS